MKRPLTAAIVVFCVILLPTVALAEVSVQLDQHGNFKRFFFITKEHGRSVVWGQHRGYLPLELILNPLGDNLGDHPPRIATHPETGFPWVVWSMNVANQMRIGFATWDGKRWTTPARIVRIEDPMGHHQLDPQIGFDAAGVPYLFFSVDDQVSGIYFSTMIGSRWTPPLLVSEEEVDSRRPTMVLGAADVSLSFDTPTGRTSRLLSMRSLIEMSGGIMDNPIPPGSIPDPDDPVPFPGDSGSGSGGSRHIQE